MKIEIAPGPALDADDGVEICLVCDEAVLDAWVAARAADFDDEDPPTALDDETTEAMIKDEITRAYLEDGVAPAPAPLGVARFKIRALTYREAIAAEKAAMRAWPMPVLRPGDEISQERVLDAGLQIAEHEYQRIKAALLSTRDLHTDLEDGAAAAEALHPERGSLHPLSLRTEIRSELSRHIGRLSQLGPAGKARYLPLFG